MRCLYRETAVIAGDYAEVNIYPVFGNARNGVIRKKRFRPTRAVQDILNKKNAVKKLAALLNANFTSKDIRLDLTYKDEFLPETEEEANRDFDRFKRRVRRYLKKNGLDDLKYVRVLEGKRYHFHIVCNLASVPTDVIRELWGKGFIGIANLEFNDLGLLGLARYMLKHPLGFKSFVGSRNLVQPVKTEVTGRLSQKKVNELAGLSDCSYEFEKLYPGYKLADCVPFYNDFNGFQYLTVRLRRKEAKT